MSKALSRGHDNSGWALTNISIIPERYDKQHAAYPGARLLAVVRLPFARYEDYGRGRRKEKRWKGGGVNIARNNVANRYRVYLLAVLRELTKG